MARPVVAIVGRPNVGKSTLFNRIIGQRTAIVEDHPGVTRDRLYRNAEWAGRSFTLVDTGGLVPFGIQEMAGNIKKQVEMAISEADAILFVLDARAGLTGDDEEIAGLLRKSHKPVLLAANKVENFLGAPLYMDFYRLGLGDPIPVSAEEGMNTGDLLDALVSLLPGEECAGEDEDSIKVAVIGRPNVGKSSIVNRLLGEERVIVSETPGTTRDAVDSAFEHGGRRYVIIDTAGIRRKSKVDLTTERYSVIRAFRAVERCDIALFVVDAVDGVTDQDKKIAGFAHEEGKASVTLVNKWDLIDKETGTAEKFARNIREELPFMKYSPVLFVSALTGLRTSKIMSAAAMVSDNYVRRVPTPALNNLIRDSVAVNPPPSYKGRKLKIYYVSPGGVKPPVFLFFVNDPGLVHFSYLRYLENRIREAFDFEGVPIRLVLKKRGEGQG